MANRADSLALPCSSSSSHDEPLDSTTTSSSFSLARTRSSADEPLPETWPDRQQNQLRLLRWFLTAPFVRRPLAEVPSTLELARPLPDYVREAFHGLPNGYYSINLVEGYDRGFELWMLGQVQPARRRLAARMRGLGRVLDVGCGTGRLAEAMHAEGIREVWGIDPSPYVLQRAQRRTPSLRTVQGLIEDTDFPDACFEAAAAFFVLHELPKEVANRALDELARIVRPGGMLCITEPAEEHIKPKSLWGLVRDHGVGSLYFHALARMVYEPFLADWQSVRDHEAWLDAHGFDLVEREVKVPFSTLVARRRQ